MIFTTIENKKKQTYEGFSGTQKPKSSKNVSLVIAWVDGERDIWYLDNTNPIALQELERYYRTEQQHLTRLQVFSNKQIDKTYKWKI